MNSDSFSSGARRAVPFANAMRARRTAATQRSRSRGAAAVELALILLPLTLMALAAVEYGRLMFTYQIILKSARDGARYMSTFSPSANNYAAAVANVRNRVVYGSNTASGNPLAVGLTTAMVCVYDRLTPAPAGCGAFTAANFSNLNVGAGLPTINVVRVEVRGYVFQPIFPLPLATVNFEPISATMRQW